MYEYSKTVRGIEVERHVWRRARQPVRRVTQSLPVCGDRAGAGAPPPFSLGGKGGNRVGFEDLNGQTSAKSAIG